ncbi:type IV secretion system protein [Aliarcobacter butzleri]|uniref:type IV secretion system protein n=1 Tax=Aliarcobacter butzleri TaxID=28197 RepID=UPI001EDB6025|nr:type IV secretion system protein [Aliarcobacter butzleri]MCG3671937.1 type IV secretion system protein [Aliarcobacter butzleri]
MNSNFFQGLGNFVGNIFSFLDNTDIQTVIQSLASLLTISLTIIVMFEAYKIMAGKSEGGVRDLLWRLATIMFIATFSLDVGYMSIMKEAFESLHYMMSGDISLYAKLDKLFDEAIKLGNAIYKSTPDTISGALLGIFLRILVMIGFVIGVIPAFLVVVTTELTLKILLLLLPIAIYSLIYKFSKNIFSQWLSLFTSNALTILIVGMLLGAVLDTYTRFQISLLSKIGSSDVTAIAFQSFIMGIILLGLVKVSQQIAEKLGTVSIEALGQSALGRELVGSAKNWGKTAKYTGETGIGSYNAYQDTRGYVSDKLSSSVGGGGPRSFTR